MKKDSRGLFRAAAGNPRSPRLLPGTLGNFPGCLREQWAHLEQLSAIRKKRLEEASLLHQFQADADDIDVGMQPWALSLPDKELCLREALAVCTPPAPEPSAKRPGS